MSFKQFKCALLLGLGVVIAAPVVGKDDSTTQKYRPLVSEAEVQKAIAIFVNQMAQKHGFDEVKLLSTLQGLNHREDIIQRISKPAEGLPWHRYRKIFIQPKRVNQGVEFWEQHQDLLEAAYEKYGVDPAIIVGIIGVETFYGRIQGSFPVLEALHTLGFYYPKRSKFFKSELEQYLLLAREQQWPLESVKGSYAGAMGMGQFISSSYRHYGVDFNNDGKINLFTDTADMIGSVANYFKRHGWQKGGFVARSIHLDPSKQNWVQSKLKLTHQLNDFKAAKILASDESLQSKKAGIFEFTLQDGKEHWLVGDNFYAITRYNHSKLYALAAFQLSEQIREKRAESRLQLNKSAIKDLAK